MGQILHPRATTTQATRREIQNSQESIRKLAKRIAAEQEKLDSRRVSPQSVYPPSPPISIGGGFAERCFK